jgi:hypothetical protein
VALKRAGRWLGGLRECTRKKRGGGQLRGKEGGGIASMRPGTRFGREWLAGFRACPSRGGHEHGEHGKGSAGRGSSRECAGHIEEG